MTTADALRQALSHVIDPEIRKPITELDMVDYVEFEDGHATIGVKLTIVGCPAADRIESDVRRAAASVPEAIVSSSSRPGVRR